jgi:3-phenylpropionate/cinnamic acid dioxygenase small subunit
VGIDVDREILLLVEERAVLRTLHEYAHAMDHGDEEGWVDAFTPDAVFDVIDVVAGSRVHREDGHQDLAAYIAAYPKPPSFRKHVVVDPIVDIDLDAEEARVRAYWLLLQRNDDGTPSVTAFGHYRDLLVKQDGRWRIKERYADVEATDFAPPVIDEEGVA